MRITEIGDGGLEAEGEEVKQEGEIDVARLKAKQALVWAGARVLFYPTLLYNVLRNRLEPEFRWWDLVDPFVLLGAVPFPSDVPHLQQIGVRGVVTLNEKYETLVPSQLYQDHGIDHLVIPTRDYLFAPTPESIRRAVDFIHINALNGRITYVHCKAGRGRSTTVVLCYLVKHRKMTPDAALDHVRSRRPRVLLAPSQWRAVQAFSRFHAEYPLIRNPNPISSPNKADEVIVTAADLEGYCLSNHANEDRNFCSCHAVQSLQCCTSPYTEDVLVTDADLEGYETYASTCKDLVPWQNAQQANEYQNSCSCQAMLPMQCGSPRWGEEVFVTDGDLEGYETYASTCKETVLPPNTVDPQPINGKLLCLFGALKLAGSCKPTPSRPLEVHAC